jgi:hypothetical protein
MSNHSAVNFKFIITIFLSALFAYAVGIYGNLPWWSFVVTNFLISVVIVQKPSRAFIAGALGVGLLWLTLSLLIDIQNNHILSIKVATLLPFKGAYWALILLTSVIGFLLGGLAALSGAYIRNK